MMAPNGGDITIVAGGWSARNVPQEWLAGRIIAVNDAAVHLETWHHAVSMDRLWTESRLEEVQLRSMEDSPFGEIWIRRNALQNFTPESIERVPNLTAFECDHESDEFTPALYRTAESHGAPRLQAQLNGRNSGQCALNLAYHLRPARVFLVGFDLNRGPDGMAYWYQPYPWSSPTGGSSAKKYQDWAHAFNAAQRKFDEIGVLVYNVSPTSAIPNFCKVSPATYRKLTT